MKRFVSVLAGLLVLPAFAEVAPIYLTDEVVEYAEPDAIVEEDVAAEEEAVVTPAPAVNTSSPRSATNRAGVSRTLPTAAVAGGANRMTSGNARGVATRTNSGTSGNVARATTSRAATTSASRGVSASRGTRATRSNTAATTRGNGNNSKGVVARAATTPLKDSGDPLYIGRVGVRGSTASISARVPTIRMASGISTTTTESVAAVAETTSDMDELAQLTDFCKAQYTQCMDNFCNVLDDNQGRCSCSRNLKNYEKTELALKQATQDLQDVAQKIQYIGLTADEITTLFTQTEAELKMQSTTDNTQLKNDLDKIQKMIIEAKSASASSTSDAEISMDLSNFLDFSISSTGFDLGALFGGTSSNTNSISNQRGEQLFKTASARCKAAVLNSCANQGVDIAVITNSYDLEIDKQCIAYERNLNDSNDQMTATVRNAKSVLQKARLLVAQQKNQYDLRGCINALDSCMQDDFVCGSDYEQCLDPTGRYIVNGEVVIGSDPGMPGGDFDKDGKAKPGLYTVWQTADTTNAWSAVSGKEGSVGDFIDKNMSKATSSLSTNTADMVTFLRRKIGYIDTKTGNAMGMCVGVMNKCQDFTYKKNGSKSTFNDNNPVVTGYLERVLVQIKAAQDSVLADYGESCISDVASCLNNNNSSTYNMLGSYSTTTDLVDTISDVAIHACRAHIHTCRSVTGYEDVDANDRKWLEDTFRVTANDMSNCWATGGSWVQSTKDATEAYCTCTGDLKGNSSEANKSKYCVCKTDGQTIQSDGKCK